MTKHELTEAWVDIEHTLENKKYGEIEECLFTYNNDNPEHVNDKIDKVLAIEKTYKKRLRVYADAFKNLFDKVQEDEDMERYRNE